MDEQWETAGKQKRWKWTVEAAYNYPWIHCGRNGCEHITKWEEVQVSFCQSCGNRWPKDVLETAAGLGNDIIGYTSVGSPKERLITRLAKNGKGKGKASKGDGPADQKGGKPSNPGKGGKGNDHADKSKGGKSAGKVGGKGNGKDLAGGGGKSGKAVTFPTLKTTTYQPGASRNHQWTKRQSSGNCLRSARSKES